MLGTILPVAKIAAPYIVRGAIEAAKIVGLTAVGTYGATRVVTHHVEPGSLKGETKVETVKNEVKFAGQALYSGAKHAVPSSLLFGAGVVLTPVVPAVGIPLITASYVVAAWPLVKAFLPVKDEWVDVEVHPEGERKVAMEFEGDKVSAETHAVWDEAALGDTEVTLAELDIARFKRTPGAAGRDFAKAIGADPDKLRIARRLLEAQLEEEPGISPHKVSQALAGYDAVATASVA